ncbi:Spore development regulator vosA [Cladobotryum mycophilum]|uniref:Spore development regulator vosA n=1 Tax=Cladobotryum mycophilum TaxID=491253 RepID=A0ABR0SEC7_9HYPO
MSFAAVNLSSQPYGGLDAVSRRPYSDGASDRYASNESQRSHRLPPPQGLVDGTHWASDSVRSHTQERRYPVHSPYYQDGPSPNAISPSPSPSIQSPSHITYPPTASHRAYPGHIVPEHSQPRQQPMPMVFGHSSLAASQYSQNPEPLPPRTSLPRPHQPLPRSDVHPNASDPHQPISNPITIMNQEPTITPPPPPPPPRLPRTDSVSHATMIPNLLGANRAQALGDIGFSLRMRQQPNAARACGFGDRDRRVIDPPPIVELVIEGSSLTTEEIRTYLRYESYVMSCSIYDESGTRDSSYMPDEYQNQRRLMGSLISTPFVGFDERDQEGCFFCFSDLSCRTPGTFRLKFTLMMIDPSRAGPVRHFPILAEIKSEPFKVYSAKEFPGMVASSRLAKRLKEQGCIISIKKGNDRTKNSRTQEDMSGDDDDGESSQGPRKRRAIG